MDVFIQRIQGQIKAGFIHGCIYPANSGTNKSWDYKGLKNVRMI